MLIGENTTYTALPAELAQRERCELCPLRHADGLIVTATSEFYVCERCAKKVAATLKLFDSLSTPLRR